MQKINVFIINHCLGKIFKPMNDTILREYFIVSMMFGLCNFTFITFYWDHQAQKKIGILFYMGMCGSPS
jgi:hypothetical protein